MITLIKNQKDWNKYKKIQENRVFPCKLHHNLQQPDQFPCLVSSYIKFERFGDADYSVNYSFVYKSDARKLLKIK